MKNKILFIGLFLIFIIGCESNHKTSLEFDFYPTLEHLNDGDELNILVRDNTTRVIVNAEVLVNNERLINNKIIFSKGETYHLIAKHKLYEVLEYTINK